jgi:hypothetical protein
MRKHLILKKHVILSYIFNILCEKKVSDEAASVKKYSYNYIYIHCFYVLVIGKLLLSDHYNSPQFIHKQPLTNYESLEVI